MSFRKLFGLETQPKYGDMMNQCRDDCLNAYDIKEVGAGQKLKTCFQKCECNVLASVFKDAYYREKDIHLPCKDLLKDD